EGGVPEDLLSDLPLCRNWTGLAEGHALCPLGANFFIQSMYLVSAYTAAGELVAPPRSTAAPTGVHLSSATRMPHSSMGKPFGVPLSAVPAMESHASVKRQPSDGSFLP